MIPEGTRGQGFPVKVNGIFDKGSSEMLKNYPLLQLNWRRTKDYMLVGDKNFPMQIPSDKQPSLDQGFRCDNHSVDAPCSWVSTKQIVLELADLSSRKHQAPGFRNTLKQFAAVLRLQPEVFL